MNYSEIAGQLLDAYYKSRKSYADLSQETGIPKSMIQRYFTGSIDRIPTDRLEALCRALGLEVTELLGWTTDHPITTRDGRIIRAISPEQDALLNEVEAMNEEERNALSYLLAGIRASRTNG